MSNDDDLRRAIELSMQEPERPPPTELDSVNEDDTEALFEAQMKAAMEASQRETSGSNSQANKPALSERAQMEQERVARQKRMRKEAGLDDVDDEPPAKRQNVANASRRPTAGSARIHGLQSSSSTAEDSSLDGMYWSGELRQTANRHATPRKDGAPTFRISEILGKKDDLSFAIISAYCNDVEWIYQFFDPRTPVILVAQPRAKDGKATVQNMLPQWTRTEPVLRGGYGCMHMKFMLLFYKTGRLRIVISTANLVPYDWCDIENSVWVQDVPRRSSSIPHDPSVKDDFPAIFQDVLVALNVKPALEARLKDNSTLPLQTIQDLRMRWDFSKVKAQLVHSLAGKHTDTAVQKTGHTRLVQAVQNMGLKVPRGKKHSLECQGSSIGSYSSQWLNSFHWSAQGKSTAEWLALTPKEKKGNLPPIKIIFPSLATVQATTLGERGGGTIFCRENQWSATNFPRTLFHDSKSKGGPVLMHSKMIIATLKDTKASSFNVNDSDSDGDVVEVVENIGWAYIGSHNFTPSAWGNLSKNKSNQHEINIVNYELGILIPLQSEVEANKIACFQRPPPKYTSNDKPWIQPPSSDNTG